VVTDEWGGEYVHLKVKIKHFDREAEYSLERKFHDEYFKFQMEQPRKWYFNKLPGIVI